MKIIYSKNIATKDVIDLENLLNIKIPHLFLEFILNQGLPTFESDFDVYFTLDSRKSIFPFINFLKILEIMELYKFIDPDSDLLNYLPNKEFLIIGEGHGQNYIAVGIGPCNADQIFWYDDEKLELIKAADNFEKFVKNNFREGY